MTSSFRSFGFLLFVASAAACRTAGSGAPPTVQPGAPGQPTKVLTATAASALPQPRFTAADVKFMQGMIGHHSQAIEMTDLLSTRSTDPDMKKLAHRIELSQADEIKMMRDWLTQRGQPLPDPHAHHAQGGALMPGMLSADEMGRLAAASGVAFDKLFLEYMIKHHAGALTMVKELFSAPGAAQESEIFGFATDVDADQRMEIDRMGAMLKERQK